MRYIFKTYHKGTFSQVCKIMFKRKTKLNAGDLVTVTWLV
jgi:hypothetical protein